jgi:hypothetical protein
MEVIFYCQVGNFKKNCYRDQMQYGGFQFMLLLDLSFNPVVVVGLGYDFLFKSILRHCGSPAAILFTYLSLILAQTGRLHYIK